MADIELVIKIDEQYIKQIDKIRFLIGGIEDRSLQINIINAIKNGTPLPKGHGKLIDVTTVPQEDKNIAIKTLLKPGTIACVGAIRLQEYINSLPTIIEADKTESKETDDYYRGAQEEY